MFSVGLTGGIGSGKSTVSELFKKLGVTIIDADQIAHDITKPGTYALESIVEHFGKSVLKTDGSLNRRTLRKTIFENPEERKWLENKLHPIIREAMKLKIAKADTVYCLLVIPLLTETKLKNYDYLDRICVIDAPESIQIERTAIRDNISEAEVKSIIQSQASNAERLSIADDVIQNDGDLNHLKEQVLKLNQHYLALAEKKS